MQTKKTLFVAFALLAAAATGWAQKSERGVVKMGKEAVAVIDKGTWAINGTISGTSFKGENYALAIIKGINTNGYDFSVKPKIMVGVAKNLAVGIRGGYKRGAFDLESAGINVAETAIEVKDLYSIRQSYGGDVFVRYYMPIGNSPRFAIIGDLYAGGDAGESKLTKRDGNVDVGTFQTNWSINCGVDFGAMAFITKNFAIEAELGILGFGLTGSKAVKNQIYNGGTNTINGYYSVNFLSLSVGASMYF